MPDRGIANPPLGGKLLVQGVSKWFRTQRGMLHALDDIELSVGDGEFVCLVGPSGCGKSTLLDIIAGLTRPDRGLVLADGQKVDGPARHRLVMFQESALFPWLTALGNVLFGLKLVPELSRAARREIAIRHLAMVGLERFAYAYVHQLSGGMRQRVAFARSLAPDPQVLLMDEPLSALDALTREQLYADIQRIQQDRRKTIVLVTHNVREAVCLGDRVVLLSPRPGRIRESFQIRLPRARDVNSVQLAEHAEHITTSLRAYVPAEVQ